jgi:imidazolonepropionase-like amidohydrolase
MLRARNCLLGACLLCAAGAAAADPTVAADATAAEAGGDLAIVNARIYPSAEALPIEHGTLLVRDGRIASIAAAGAVTAAPASAVIDAHDRTVLAGFWNCHVHLITPALLHAREQPAEKLSAELEGMFTRWGFTTVFDVASELNNTEIIRERIAAGEVTGPRIFTVGNPFFPEHGTPIYVHKYLEDNGFPSFEVATADEARARARRQLAAGADGVKIFAGAIVGGEIGVLPMRLDIASAVVNEAHRAGKPAFAHPSNAAGVEVAIRSGVDVLAHTAPLMGPWSPQLIARMRAHHMALTPTLTLVEVEERKAGAPTAQIERLDQVTTQQLRAFADRGGLILFGTDIGYIDVYDTTREFQLMSRALSWRQILASLTTNPARRFAHGGGTIVPGAAADLTIIDGDPAADVTALARVRYTIRDGRIIYQHR